MNKPLISLCMPTNGVIDWVFPVLESIYNQKVNNELFENTCLRMPTLFMQKLYLYHL